MRQQLWDRVKVAAAHPSQTLWGAARIGGRAGPREVSPVATDLPLTQS